MTKNLPKLTKNRATMFEVVRSVEFRACKLECFQVRAMQQGGAEFSASLQSPLPVDFVIDFLGPDTQETIETLVVCEDHVILHGTINLSPGEFDGTPGGTHPDYPRVGASTYSTPSPVLPSLRQEYLPWEQMQ
jgi:hypothetical protein